MDTPISGGCACKAVRYKITQAPYGQANCHCRACQRATGSAFAPMMLVPTSAFAVTGSYSEYTSKADSGHEVTRMFCGHCGSNLFVSTTRVPSMRPVYATSLDDPSVYEPQLDAWVDFAQPWVCLNKELPKYQRDLPATCAGL